MAVVVVHEIPGGTQEDYEKVVSLLTDGGTLDSVDDWPVEGLVLHTAAPTDRGWRVVDVWESEEAFKAFGEVLVPKLQEAGLGGEPEMTQAYKVIK